MAVKKILNTNFKNEMRHNVCYEMVMNKIHLIPACGSNK